MAGSGLRTPSLRLRLIAAGMVTWVVLVLSLDVFVFLSLRTQLEGSLDELLQTRATLAQELAVTLDLQGLDERLTELGVPATVRSSDGQVVRAEPAAPGFGEVPPGFEDGDADLASLTVDLADGETVTVFASRAGVDQTLDRVLLLEAIGSAAVVMLMLVLMLRMSRALFEPIDRVVGTARDIVAGQSGQRLRPDRPDTELGRMAAAFDEMLDSLEGALEQAHTAEAEARDAETRSRRFLADAAHQLRTPVASVRALVDTLMRTEEPGDQQQLLDTLAREAARMTRLVTSLMRMAEMDRGDPLRRTASDVVDVIRNEVVRAREHAPSIAISLDTVPDVVEAFVDPDVIAEAVANVLENARRHAVSRIEFEVGVDGGDLVVSVGDDGPGIPPGTADRVFERFASLDGYGGTGLGLAIGRASARAHGGDLTWDGRRFVLRIPLSTGDP